ANTIHFRINFLRLIRHNTDNRQKPAVNASVSKAACFQYFHFPKPIANPLVFFRQFSSDRLSRRLANDSKNNRLTVQIKRKRLLPFQNKICRKNACPDEAKYVCPKPASDRDRFQRRYCSADNYIRFRYVDNVAPDLELVLPKKLPFL